MLTTSNQSTMQCSEREMQIIRLIAFEYTSSEIAARLFISESTVDTHRRRIFKKLGVRNAAGMVRRGFELSILKIGTTIR